MNITFIKKSTPTNAATLGIETSLYKEASVYGLFHFTFLGFEFFCHDTQRVLRKSQVFWKNPIQAHNMAKTLIIPPQYMLVDYTRPTSKA